MLLHDSSFRYIQHTCILFSDAGHAAFLPNKNRFEWTLEETIPELVESLLVSVKHVSNVEVQGVGCVPVLQLLEVGVLCESHVVQRGLLCSAVIN